MWLAHDGNLTGANICLLEHISILKGQGFKNELVIPWEGTLVSRAKDVVEKIHVVPFYPWSSPLGESKPNLKTRTRKWIRNRMAIANFARLIRQVKPNFVATNTITTNIAAVAARQCGIRHVWFVHEYGEEDHGFTIAGKFSRGAKIINSLSEKVIFNSTGTLQKFDSYVPKSKQHVVYNAVHLHREGNLLTKQGEGLKLIMLGQVAPSKNHMEALAALKICRNVGVEVMLIIVGKDDSGHYTQYLMDFVRSNALEEYVEFFGATGSPQEVLITCDALLMCSRMEAFGRVTVEALKCGLPVIAANTGGSLEIVNDKVNGLLYESGSASDLAEKIKWMAANVAMFDREAIANEANNRFNLENTKTQLLPVFS